MPVGLTAAHKGDSLRLLNSLTEYVSDGFVFDEGFWKTFLSKSSQAAKKQPVERKMLRNVKIGIQTVQEMCTDYIIRGIANTGGYL